MPPSSIVSRLVVPGHLPKLHAKALETKADEVVFDLEDAVAPDGKPEARRQVARTLSDPRWATRAVAVRVNASGSPQHVDDLVLCAELHHPHLSLVVPKVDAPRDIQAAAEIAPVQALIETPDGLAEAALIARHPRVVALILGYADLAASLGRRGGERDESRWLVAQETVLGAARIGGAAAVNGPSFALRDTAAVRMAARAARELGYDGMWAIHPSQIAPITAEFATSEEEREWARRVKAAVADTRSSGSAVAALDGAMVDEAMVRRADRLLALPSAAARPRPRAASRIVAAPYYEDLHVGSTFHAVGLTLTEAHAAMHQAIVGDRLRLALDADLYAAVVGSPGLLAHPMLVCDVAIGQSTAPSMRVLGNLFYRGLHARPIPLGTTLRTRTDVVGRRSASGRRGVVVLHVRTSDQNGATVVDLHRAPLLPAAADHDEASSDGLLDVAGEPTAVTALVPNHWSLQPLRDTALGPAFAELATGDTIAVEATETVTAAPELARLSLNMAHTHTDASQGRDGRRLVYGGHIIGIAAAQVTRALPDLATILAWTSCEHLNPTFEGDRLQSFVEITDLVPLADGGLVHLRVQTTSFDAHGRATPVLDWRLVGLMP